MRLSSIAIITAAFASVAGLCLVAAGFAVNVIEDNSEISVREALDDSNMTWAEVHANGLQVFLSGTAPSEATRFKAVTTAGTIVDAARIIDQMEVKDSGNLKPPRFSVEILRNDSGISLIGLVPASTDREALVKTFTALANGTPVTDLLETADYPVPDTWEPALAYGIAALKKLPRSKVSIAAGRVAITAISDSAEAKAKLETELARATPNGVRLAIEVSAPRPVISPFTLRFLIDEDGARFDACAADSDEARDRIIAAATKAGLQGKANCTVGLGVPSKTWAQAAETAIGAVAELQGGTVTFSDADISLIAPEGTNPAIFDRVVGELENALPEVFALNAVLTKTENASAAGPAEFVATLSPEGQVQLRGRISDELTRTAAESLAKARFGAASVHMAARIDETLPNAWPLRVLTGLEALSRLSNGAVTVTPDLITVSGNTGKPTASDDISRLLADKLGEDQRFDISVTYQKKLDPILGLPTPDECEADIKEVLKSRKINFEPGSATPDAEARGIIDDIAAILEKCGDVQMEIGGHTDSQGREEMNQQLSQQRAQAVLTALRERRIITSGLSAVGYGEAQPIADNGSEDGRETNRRIEFRLIRPAPTEPERETTLESVAQTGEEDPNTADDQTVNPQDATKEQGSGD